MENLQSEIWLGARFADGSVLVREVQHDTGLESTYRAREEDVSRRAKQSGICIYLTEAYKQHQFARSGGSHRPTVPPA